MVGKEDTPGFESWLYIWATQVSSLQSGNINTRAYLAGLLRELNEAMYVKLLLHYLVRKFSINSGGSEGYHFCHLSLG
jgi:hypothetical protein